MDEATKRKIAQLIVGLIVVDDDLDPDEDTFIDKMLAQFGIADEERRAVIFPIVDNDEAARSFGALPKEVQKQAFRLLVEAAAADGKIVEQERSYLTAVSKAAGIEPQELEDILTRAVP